MGMGTNYNLQVFVSLQSCENLKCVPISEEDTSYVFCLIHLLGDCEKTRYFSLAPTLVFDEEFFFNVRFEKEWEPDDIIKFLEDEPVEIEIVQVVSKAKKYDTAHVLASCCVGGWDFLFFLKNHFNSNKKKIPVFYELKSNSGLKNLEGEKNENPRISLVVTSSWTSMPVHDSTPSPSPSPSRVRNSRRESFSIMSMISPSNNNMNENEDENDLFDDKSVESLDREENDDDENIVFDPFTLQDIENNDIEIKKEKENNRGFAFAFDEDHFFSDIGQIEACEDPQRLFREKFGFSFEEVLNDMKSTGSLVQQNSNSNSNRNNTINVINPNENVDSIVTQDIRHSESEVDIEQNTKNENENDKQNENENENEDNKENIKENEKISTCGRSVLHKSPNRPNGNNLQSFNRMPSKESNNSFSPEVIERKTIFFTPKRSFVAGSNLCKSTGTQTKDVEKKKNEKMTFNSPYSNVSLLDTNPLTSPANYNYKCTYNSYYAVPLSDKNENENISKMSTQSKLRSFGNLRSSQTPIEQISSEIKDNMSSSSKTLFEDFDVDSSKMSIPIFSNKNNVRKKWKQQKESDRRLLYGKIGNVRHKNDSKVLEDDEVRKIPESDWDRHLKHLKKIRKELDGLRDIDTKEKKHKPLHAKRIRESLDPLTMPYDSYTSYLRNKPNVNFFGKIK